MEANYVIHPITGVTQEYRHLCKVPDHKIWKKSFANELGQIAQGIRNIKGTDTIHFIPKSKVPFGEKTVTYGKIVCDIKLDKEEHCYTRLTVGGNLLYYTGNLGRPTASVTTAKCLLNSVISSPKPRALTADIKHFYLNNQVQVSDYSDRNVLCQLLSSLILGWR